MKQTKTQAARRAANKQQRKVRELTTRALGGDLLASEKRELDWQIVAGEAELSRLEREAERQEAVRRRCSRG